MKIAFILTAHLPDDERVWYQQAEALRGRGHDVFIISSRIAQSNLNNVVCFNDLKLPKRTVIHKIKNILFDINPEMMICDNPIAVIAAKKFKTKTKKKTTIVYDVTEWYPSSLNLKNINVVSIIVKFFSLTFLSFYAGCIVNKFIFGEYYKGRFFRILFPCKKFIYLPYFANIELIKQYPIRDISKECELFYSGNLTNTKGFDQVLKVAEQCAEKMPNTQFVLKIISSQKIDNQIFENQKKLKIQWIQQLPFLEFCEEIGKSDLFLDLRKINFTRNYSLPIKIFYYLATGRPVIYSKIKAIKKFFPKNEFNQWGYLVTPNHTEQIIEIIENYINNPESYNKSCNFSYELSTNKYHWNNLKEIFIDFIEK